MEECLNHTTHYLTWQKEEEVVQFSLQQPPHAAFPTLQLSITIRLTLDVTHELWREGVILFDSLGDEIHHCWWSPGGYLGLNALSVSLTFTQPG